MVFPHRRRLFTATDERRIRRELHCPDTPPNSAPRRRHRLAGNLRREFHLYLATRRKILLYRRSQRSLALRTLRCRRQVDRRLHPPPLHRRQTRLNPPVQTQLPENMSDYLTLQELVDKSFQINKSSWTSSWH